MTADQQALQPIPQPPDPAPQQPADKPSGALRSLWAETKKHAITAIASAVVTGIGLLITARYSGVWSDIVGSVQHDAAIITPLTIPDAMHDGDSIAFNPSIVSKSKQLMNAVLTIKPLTDNVVLDPNVSTFPIPRGVSGSYELSKLQPIKLDASGEGTGVLYLKLVSGTTLLDHFVAPIPVRSRYSGTWSVRYGDETLTMDLKEHDGSVVGTYNGDDGAWGSVVGTLKGGYFIATFTDARKPDRFQVEGAHVDENKNVIVIGSPEIKATAYTATGTRWVPGEQKTFLATKRAG